MRTKANQTPSPMPMPDKDAAKPRVEAVERALSVLEAFADGTAKLTLTEIATRTGLYPSTILRLYNSLDAFGYLHRDEDGAFRLGPSLWRLGVLYQNAFNLERYVRPVLTRLVDRLGETTAFYIREGEQRICLYRKFAQSSIGHHVEEGARLSLDRGASAHVLMAFTGAAGKKYDDVRRSRLYVSYGERNPDANAVAVPVFGASNEFVGALSITGPTNRLVGSAIDASIPVLQEAAQELQRTLRGR
jgi:DNA-binding IclR family transcriptional regulator